MSLLCVISVLRFEFSLSVYHPLASVLSLLDRVRVIGAYVCSPVQGSLQEPGRAVAGTLFPHLDRVSAAAACLSLAAVRSARPELRVRRCCLLVLSLSLSLVIVVLRFVLWYCPAPVR